MAKHCYSGGFIIEFDRPMPPEDIVALFNRYLGPSGTFGFFTAAGEFDTVDVGRIFFGAVEEIDGEAF